MSSSESLGEDEMMGETADDTIGEYEGGRNEELERHGEGRTILPNGDYYEGQYIHNMRHGLGLYVFMKSGARYMGQYEKAKKCGIGTFFYPDGSVYEGEWKDDMKNGFGIYLYPNGDSYEGQWHDDKRNGIGYYMYKKAAAKFLGTWQGGIMQGWGQIITKHYRYHGRWENNLPVGKGVFTFKEDAMVHGKYVHVSKESSRSNVFDTSLDMGESSPRETIAQWKTTKVTRFDATLLPPEPQPLEIPDTLSISETGSVMSKAHLEPAKVTCNVPDSAVFDKYYLDEPVIAAADSWTSNVVGSMPVPEGAQEVPCTTETQATCPPGEQISDFVVGQESKDIVIQSSATGPERMDD